MDSELKNMLAETRRLAQENNKMLKSLRRAQKISSLLRVAYWVIVIGIAVGLFYFLQPIVDQTRGFFQGANDTITNIKESFLPE